MIEVSRYFHFLLIGAYALLIVSYFQTVRSNFSRINSLYLLLCLLNLVYSIIVTAGTFGPYSPGFSIAAVLIGACLGFASMLTFTAIMGSAVYLHPLTRYLKGVLWGILSIFTLSLLEVALTGKSWSVQPTSTGYLNPFFNLLLPGLTIAPLAKLVLGIGATAATSINVHIFVHLLRSKTKDRFLIMGVGASLIVTLNDLLAGMNINHWVFPLACSGHFIEILRFQLGLIKTGNVATINLKQSIDQLSASHATREIQSRIRHDLKHILNSINDDAMTPIQLDSFKNIVSQLSERSPANSKSFAGLKPLLALSFSLLEKKAAQNDIRLDNQISSSCFAYVNSAQITVAFFNLIDNAIDAYAEAKYRMENKVIRVTSEQLDDQIVIHFSDSAGGLSEVAQERIFNIPFTTKTKGEGLGLISVKESLLQNQALIVYLPINGGCNFRVTFLNPFEHTNSFR